MLSAAARELLLLGCNDSGVFAAAPLLVVVGQSWMLRCGGTTLPPGCVVRQTRQHVASCAAVLAASCMCAEAGTAAGCSRAKTALRLAAVLSPVGATAATAAN